METIKKWIVLLFALTVNSNFAQETVFVKKGLLSAQATLSPSKMLSEDESQFYLHCNFEGFVSDLIKIGKKMDEAKIEYGNAMNKLVDGKGNRKMKRQLG